MNNTAGLHARLRRSISPQRTFCVVSLSESVCEKARIGVMLDFFSTLGPGYGETN